MKKAACLAILGTGSEVGKSIVATALCRLFVNKGINVAPFKAQNMSNNSGVTPEGLEMGRAQIVQAEAAGIVPHVDMNPILLKPTSDVGSQVVLLGEAIGNQTAMDYHQKKAHLVQIANDALDRLRSVSIPTKTRRPVPTASSATTSRPLLPSHPVVMVFGDSG